MAAGAHDRRLPRPCGAADHAGSAAHWRALAALVVFALLGPALVTAPARAAPAAGVRGEHISIYLRLAYPRSQDHPVGRALQRFAADLRAQSGGRLPLTLIPAYAGGDADQLLADVAAGSIEFASVPIGALRKRGVREFTALETPFLVTRYDLERRVITGPIGRRMLAGVGRIDLVGLALHEGGQRFLVSTRRPLVSLSSLRGARVGSTGSSIRVASLRALGAAARTLSFGRLFGQLIAGSLDGVELDLGNLELLSSPTPVKYVTANLPLSPDPFVLVVNRTVWGGYTVEQQRWFRRAAAGLPGASLDLLAAAEPLAALCRRGVRLALVAPAPRRRLVRAVRPVVARLASNPATARTIVAIRSLAAQLGPAPSVPAPRGCLAARWRTPAHGEDRDFKISRKCSVVPRSESAATRIENIPHC